MFKSSFQSILAKKSLEPRKKLLKSRFIVFVIFSISNYLYDERDML
jgi:hypothetical protein